MLVFSPHDNMRLKVDGRKKAGAWPGVVLFTVNLYLRDWLVNAET